MERYNRMPEFDFGSLKEVQEEVIKEKAPQSVKAPPKKKAKKKSKKLTVEETEFMFEYFDKIGRKRWGLKEDQKKARKIFLKLAE